MDETLRALERAANADPGSLAKWIAYLVALVRVAYWDEVAQVLRVILQRFGGEGLRAIIAALPRAGWARVVRLWEASGAEYITPRTPGGQTFVAGVIEFLIPIIVGVLQVALLVGAGLALPASKMGKLGVLDIGELPGDELADLIRKLYLEHVGLREDYSSHQTGSKLRELAYDASYLLSLIDYFLRQYPDEPSAQSFRKLRERIQAYINDYNGYGPESPPEPVVPVPMTPAPPPVEHPHTMERPLSYEEWTVAQQHHNANTMRNRILEIRRRIRELKEKQRNPDYDFEDVRRMIDRYIDEYIEELTRLRAELDGMGEATGEDTDEPLDPPAQPEAPDWPLGHDWLHPAHLYVNPATGRQQFFSGPPPAGWEPMFGEGVAPRFHWGWKPRIDGESGKVIWEPGWVPNSLQSSFSRRGHTAALLPDVGQSWDQLREARREGVDVGVIAHRHGINWTLPLHSQPQAVPETPGSLAARLAAAAAEATLARASRRGSVGWGRFATVRRETGPLIPAAVDALPITVAPDPNA